MKGAGRKWKTERLDELKETTAVEWLNEQLKCTLTISQMYDVVITDLFKEAKEMEKEQAERMYSEEDMKNAFDSAREFNSLDGIVDVHIVLPMGGDMSDLQPLHFTFEEWFEQFKKK